MVQGLVRLVFGLALAVVALAADNRPSRIVSTFPSVTETLFALGAGNRVVGVSNYCRYPPAVLSLPKVGTFTKPDPEKIAVLRPDLVIIEKSATALGERLSALGIRHADVRLGSLGDIYSTIHDIGIAIGLPDRADKLNAGIRSHLDAARAHASGQIAPSVLIIIGRTPGQLTGLIGVGPGSYLGQLLEIAGGRNILAETTVAYPQISMETIVRANPDVILDLSLMGGSHNDRAIDERLRESWLPRRELAAVRNGMIFGLTSEPLVTPGPRVVDAVDLIETTIHRKNPRQ